ncbi:MAG: hypothetical protein OXF06_05640 [Bacteroidetes bacterium]|nr:hypothetical protein [Bacteroidota bacterium]MCY4224302.1 hypothetical protein [Bacteroidota bacterium]
MMGGWCLRKGQGWWVVLRPTAGSRLGFRSPMRGSPRAVSLRIGQVAWCLGLTP